MPTTQWGPRAAIFITIAAYLVSQLILIVPIIVARLINGDNQVAQQLQDSAWLQLTFTGISAAGLLAVLWLFLKYRHLGFWALGFRKIKAGDFGWLAITALAYYFLLIVVMAIAANVPGFNADQVQDVGFQNVAGWQLGLAFIGLVVLPPLAEEMLFRGFLYRGLSKRWPRIIAALFTSALFGLVHFQWNVAVDVFILSMVLIVLYEKTKNLWMCVFLHALKNGLAFLAIFIFVS